jgi:hypothetical protein
MKHPYNHRVQFLPYTSEVEDAVGHKFALKPLATDYIVVSKLVVSFPETVDFGALGGVLIGLDATTVREGVGAWNYLPGWPVCVFTQGPHVFDLKEGFGDAVAGKLIGVFRQITAPTVLKTRFNVIAAGVDSTAEGNLAEL